MDVVVNLATSTICFLSSCYPALLGINTPKGVFDLQVREVIETQLYGREVLQFSETDEQWFAIHRVIKTPKLHRIKKLQSADPTVRRYVTNGCINVDDIVFEQIKTCCSTGKLHIE